MSIIISKRINYNLIFSQSWDLSFITKIYSEKRWENQDHISKLWNLTWRKYQSISVFDRYRYSVNAVRGHPPLIKFFLIISNISHDISITN